MSAAGVRMFSLLDVFSFQKDWSTRESEIHPPKHYQLVPCRHSEVGIKPSLKNQVLSRIPHFWSELQSVRPKISNKPKYWIVKGWLPWFYRVELVYFRFVLIVGSMNSFGTNGCKKLIRVVSSFQHIWMIFEHIWMANNESCGKETINLFCRSINSSSQPRLHYHVSNGLANQPFIDTETLH